MRLINIVIACSIALLTHAACNKNHVDSVDGPRKVQYELYTDRNFAADTSIVTFTAFIRTTNNVILWDSVLEPLQLKDIPGPGNKIMFERNIPWYPSPLKVGFDYTIEKVGHAHYNDSVGVRDKFKVISFNFR